MKPVDAAAANSKSKKTVNRILSFCAIFCKASRNSWLSKSNEGLRGLMLHNVFKVSCVQESQNAAKTFGQITSATANKRKIQD